MSQHIRARLPVITGVMFLLLALFALLQYVLAIRYEFDLYRALLTFPLCAVYIFLSIWLLLKRQDTLLLLALCVLCGVRLLGLFQPAASLFYLLHNILLFLAAAVLLVLFLVQTYPAFSRRRAAAERLTFLPALLLGIGIFVSMIATSNYMADAPGTDILFQLLADVFLGPIFGVAGYYCLAWGFCPAQKEGESPFADLVFDDPIFEGERAPKRKPTPRSGPRDEPEGEGYCSLLKHVLLLIFTLGVWYLIWIFRVTLYLNREGDEPERDPLKQLLLCFIPFYAVYWFYQSAWRVERLAEQTGLYANLAAFCTVTAFLGPVLPAALLQEKINDIVMVRGGYVPVSAFVAMPEGEPSSPAPRGE